LFTREKGIVEVTYKHPRASDVLDDSGCNALFNYLIVLLEDIVYNYILYDFDDYVTYL